MKSDQEQKEQSMEQPMSKEEARAKQAEADKEAMPEQAKMARTNADGKVVVHFGQGQKAVVHVSHQGEPHPKGFTAVIVTHSGDRIDGETRQQILDAAVDYAKGKKVALKVDEYQDELKADGTAVDAGKAQTSSADGSSASGTQDSMATNAAASQGKGETPLAGQGAGAPQASDPSQEVTPAAPGN